MLKLSNKQTSYKFSLDFCIKIYFLMFFIKNIINMNQKFYFNESNSKFCMLTLTPIKKRKKECISVKTASFHGLGNKQTKEIVSEIKTNKKENFFVLSLKRGLSALKVMALPNYDRNKASSQLLAEIVSEKPNLTTETQTFVQQIESLSLETFSPGQLQILTETKLQVALKKAETAKRKVDSILSEIEGKIALEQTISAPNQALLNELSYLNRFVEKLLNEQESVIKTITEINSLKTELKSKQGFNNLTNAGAVFLGQLSKLVETLQESIPNLLKNHNKISSSTTTTQTLPFPVLNRVNPIQNSSNTSLLTSMYGIGESLSPINDGNYYLVPSARLDKTKRMAMGLLGLNQPEYEVFTGNLQGESSFETGGVTASLTPNAYAALKLKTLEYELPCLLAPNSVIEISIKVKDYSRLLLANGELIRIRVNDGGGTMLSAAFMPPSSLKFEESLDPSSGARYWDISDPSALVEQGSNNRGRFGEYTVSFYFTILKNGGYSSYQDILTYVDNNLWALLTTLYPSCIRFPRLTLKTILPKGEFEVTTSGTGIGTLPWNTFYPSEVKFIYEGSFLSGKTRRQSALQIGFMGFPQTFVYFPKWLVQGVKNAASSLPLTPTYEGTLANNIVNLGNVLCSPFTIPGFDGKIENGITMILSAETRTNGVNSIFLPITNLKPVGFMNSSGTPTRGSYGIDRGSFSQGPISGIPVETSSDLASNSTNSKKQRTNPTDLTTQRNSEGDQ